MDRPLLFLSESVVNDRQKLLDQAAAGTITRERESLKALELIPDDHPALNYFTRRCFEQGEMDAAREYSRRNLAAHPWSWSSYLSAYEIADQLGDTFLADGFGELAVRKMASDAEALQNVPPATTSDEDEEPPELSREERLEVLQATFRKRRDLEPPETTAFLRPHRVFQAFLDDESLDAELVDAIVSAGAAMAPFLIGVLRGWAHSLIPDEQEHLVENALALLGEIGDPAAIPYALEFAALGEGDLARAGSWALDRIVSRRLRDSARQIVDILPSLSATERIVVMERVVRHPGLDPAGKIVDALCANLEQLDNDDLQVMIPSFVTALVVSSGKPGLAKARALLRQNSNRISGPARAECEGLIQMLGDSARGPLPIPEPSPWTVYDICAGNAIWEEDEESLEDEEALDEEDLDLSPPVSFQAPARTHSNRGRNDPCWCGSGRKYKKCHLDSDQGGQREQSPELESFDDLRSKIGDFLAKAVPFAESHKALAEFHGDSPDEESGASMEFIDWMIHDRVIKRLGRTVMEEYFRRHESMLSPGQRNFIQSSIRSAHRLYEVQEVHEGEGAQLKDLIRGDQLFVHDRTLSRTVVRWDVFLGRVVNAEHGCDLTGVIARIHRSHVDRFMDWLRSRHEESGLSWDTFFKSSYPEIRRAMYEVSRQGIESLEIRNSEGNVINFGKAVYRIDDLPAAIEGLRSSPEINEDTEGERYVWLEGGGDRPTVLGSVEIHGNELRLACNSTQRLDRGKALLAEVAGASVRHLRDEFTSLEELKRQAAAAPRGSSRSRSPEVPKEPSDILVSEIKERHYDKWLDDKIPALGGKTPREAVQTAEGREQVIDILKSIENLEEQKRRSGEPFYDVNRIRRALGLEVR